MRLAGPIVLALVGCRTGTAPEPPAIVEAPPALRDAPVAWRSCLLDGTTPCVSAAPIRVADELLAWSTWLGRRADQEGHGVTECRWVAELDHVLLCGSSDREAMNPPLIRPAIFIENKPRVVVRHDDAIYANLVSRIGGFDLLKRHPARTHPDLIEFYGALDQACAKDTTICGDPGEVAMRALLERAWADRPSFVLLAFANRSSVADDEAVSHEILHAQYFTNPAYREVVAGYWSGLSDAMRATIRAELGTIYHPDDEELMQNEMQAYALMSGSERSRYGTSLAQHGPPLAKLLAARGITPVVVERRVAEPLPMVEPRAPRPRRHRTR